jgi:hypothetical protein
VNHANHAKRKCGTIAATPKSIHPAGEQQTFPNLFPVRVVRMFRGLNCWIQVQQSDDAEEWRTHQELNLKPSDP